MKPLMSMLAILFVFVVGCAEHKKASEEIDAGTLNGSTYRNEYFGLTVTVPDDWSIQDQETRKQMMEMGGQVVAGDDKNLQAAVEAAETTTVNLLTAFQYPIETPVPYNPNFMCMAEQIRHAPGVRTAGDYLSQVKHVLQSPQVQASFPQANTNESVGGRNFEVMHVDMTVFNMTIHQKLYARIAKDYALCFAVSYTTDEEKETLQSILDTVAFE